jgi:hypothetical protein
MRSRLLLRNLLILPFFAQVACVEKANDFHEYSRELTRLQTPLVLKTIEYPPGNVSSQYDSVLFKKYKFHDAESVFGVVYAEKDYTGIVYTVSGDIAVPVLVTYDKNGKRVDSLNLFGRSTGFGLDRETYERVTFLSDGKIMVVDSTVSWMLNAAKDDRVENSEKIKKDSIVYEIDVLGKLIKKVK